MEHGRPAVASGGSGHAAPSAEVVRAFGGSDRPVRMAGGRGASWRSGAVVLKPAGPEADATLGWLQHVVRPAVGTSDVRIALPLATRDGSLRFGGWEATAWLVGERPTGRWHERADIARRFTRALRDVDPSGLPHREDPWAAADRAAWGEAPGPLDGHPLHRRLGPSSSPVSVVHRDLAGNTLVHGVLPPAVIDLSLSARPAEWSVAILTVDVVAFEGGPPDLVRTMSAEPDFLQLVARALLFRMTTDVLIGGAPDAAYAPLTETVLGAIG